MSSKKDLDERLAILRKMSQDGTLDKDQYLQGIVCIAYEHAILGNLEDVRILVCSCEDDYISSVMPQQMRENEDFRAAAVFVAETLAATGVKSVSNEDLFLALAKIGKA